MFFLEPNKLTSVKIFLREKDMFHQTEFFNIQQESSKLRTYSRIKREIGMQEYLTEIHNLTDRTSMSKFRLSNHRLMIETGRHKKIEKHNRKCPFCPQDIEDEVHFLTTCPSYYPIRENLFAKLQIPNLNFYYDKYLMFEYLMTNKEAVKHTAKFLNSAFSVREFLTANHRYVG